MTGRAAAAFPDQAAANAAAAELATAALVVADRRSEIVEEAPPLPYTTATLLEDATTRFGWEAVHIMTILQRLFEGIELHGAHTGLITYHRTDSTHVAPEAVVEARAVVARLYGAAALSKSRGEGKGDRGAGASPARRGWLARLAARLTRDTSHMARDTSHSHEAIRPTLAARLPDALQPYLDADALALYRLIWERFVASQMKAARYRITTVELETA